MLLQLGQVSVSLGERLTERKDETDRGPELTKAVGEKSLTGAQTSKRKRVSGPFGLVVHSPPDR